MWQTRSSNGSRYLLATILIAALPACTHSSGGGSGTSTSAHGQVGYVRMDDLVKFHPLYAQLTQLDDDMAALQLKGLGQTVAVSPADLKHEEVVLQRELDAATERAKSELKQKQEDYSRRENDAIRQAMAAAGGGGGGAPIASSMQAQLQAQAQAVSADAQKNLAAYRDSLLKQDQAAVGALTRSVNERAGRTYRTQVEAYQKKEADYALQLAGQDSAARLSLRAKLSNLVLDDAARADARKQLDALDRKEADELAALKNRDASALAELQTTLREQTRLDLDTQVAAMHKATLAKINAREADARRTVVAKLGELGGSTSNGTASVTLTPDLQAKLQALHKQYQQDFNQDAQRTLDEFQKTKAALANRFARLEGIDLGAEQSANKEIAKLQKQRNDLYSQMVAQIGREVKLVAARRGVDVVLSNVLAPAGGVDLTSDAEKDIESLHE